MSLRKSGRRHGRHLRYPTVNPGGGGSPGDWDALTPYTAVNRTLLNAGSALLTQPFVQGLHFAQRGDIPAGSVPALFSGSTRIPTQVDLVAPPYADGSFSVGSFTAIIPDTLAANGVAGDRITYQIKAAVPGSSTPKFSLATWSAANDVRLTFRTNFVNQNDDTANFEFKVSDCIAAGIVEGVNTGSGYPLYSMRTDRSGPVCMGWKFRGYMRRKSDGAYHTQLVAEVYVTAVTQTDMLIECALSMPRAVETQVVNPLQTVGPVKGADFQPMTGLADLTLNGTVIKTWGGPTDQRAVTFAATTKDVSNNATVPTVDVSTNTIVFPDITTHRPGKAIGYVFTSTGTLPGGMDPGHVYWTQLHFYQQRVYLSHARMWTAPSGVGSFMTQWQANTVVPAVNSFTSYVVGPGPYDANLKQRWFPIQIGTTGTTAPTYTGSLDVVDGTVHWTPINLVLTSAGTGTLSCYPVIHVFPLCKTPLVEEATTDPVWTGSGPAPRVENILDLTYHLRYARALPPYDLTLNPMYPTQFTGWDGYRIGEPVVQFQIDNGGDDPGTPLVGYLNNTHTNAMLQQDSVIVQRAARSEALGWMDHWSMADDPRSFMPIVGNLGPGNVAGQYAGLGPSESNFLVAWTNKAPNKFTGVGSNPFGSWYDAKYQVLMDGSHLPAMWVQPYHKTARVIFLDQGLDLANANMMCAFDNQGRRGRTILGKYYASCIAIFDQVRGMGWSVRCTDTIYDVLPANHAMRAYWNDVWQDSQDAAEAAIEDNRINRPAEYNLGLMLWREMTGNQSQFFFTSIFLLAIAQAARKGRGGGGWRRVCEHVFGRYFGPWFDDAGPGNAGLADWNPFPPVNYNVARAAAGDVLTITAGEWNLNMTASPPLPPAHTFTVPAGATPASLAQALVAFINATPDYTNFNLVALYDSAGYFRLRSPSAFFDPNNRHTDAYLIINSNNTTTGITRTSLVNQIAPQNNVGNFPDIATMIEYNVGPDWPKSNTTQLSEIGTLIPPYDAPGWFPWGTVGYHIFVRMALATAAEAGIQGPAALGTGSTIRQINDAVEARFRSAKNGPPRFSGSVSGKLSTAGLPNTRTYPNFNIRTFDQQAAHPNGG